MQKKKGVGIWLTVSLLLFVGGCAVPVAWSTAPIFPLAHTQEEGAVAYGGLRVGQPTQEDATERLLLTAHAGFFSQWKLVRLDFTAWGGQARYTFLKQVDSTTYEVGVRSTVFHLQGNLALAPQVGEKVRIEMGLGAGVGYEHWNRTPSAYPYHLPEELTRATIPTFSSFAGLSYSLQPDATVGLRWHFLGAGTGLSLAYRLKLLQLTAATQLYPLFRAGENVGYGNWTFSVAGYLPLQ